LAVQTLTVPSRSYAVGTTRAIKSLPNSQQYSQLQITADCSGWTSALTTRVEIAVDWSFVPSPDVNNDAHWQAFCSVIQTVPPPWASKAGASSTLKSTCTEPAPRDPTAFRGRVMVEGQAVTLGPIVVNAS
jgi:hypothetical protein